MSKYLSRKIKFISVFAIIAVVFIHSYNYSDSFLTPSTKISEGFKFSAMFEYFFSNELFRFAVPLFFAISGFLFFFSYENSKTGYFTKIKKRSFSLLVPYILWALISGIFIMILSNFKPFSDLDIVKERAVDIKGFLYYLINPPAFQLWFIQQLIIFTIISPVIYLLIKHTKAFILIPFGIFWLFDFNFIINSQALFYFSFGSAIAIFKKSKNITRKEDKRFTAAISAVWVLLSLGNTILAASATENVIFTILLTILYKINEVVGLVSMWLIFDHIAKRISNKKAMLLTASHLFFVYALHEPLLHICYQLALKQSTTAFSHILLYICLPISISAFCIIVSMVLRKVAKPAHKLLTGGRQQ